MYDDTRTSDYCPCDACARSISTVLLVARVDKSFHAIRLRLVANFRRFTGGSRNGRECLSSVEQEGNAFETFGTGHDTFVFYKFERSNENKISTIESPTPPEGNTETFAR